jgi:predicted flavoprotein YhiN
MPESQVTAGGADCSEFSPQTMESKIEKGVFASGEVLNVDGDCGGFNLMFATASGILAGMYGRKDGLF